MNLIQKKLKIGVAIATLATQMCYAKEVLHLPFDEANGIDVVTDTISRTNFNIRHVNNPAERVNGVLGNAFRTDGYSTWLTGRFTQPIATQLSIETWIALESYPSTEEGNARDSALLHQLNAGKGFIFGINTYGNWWFTVNVAGQQVKVSAPDRFPLYAWSHVAATVDNGLIKVFVNGVKVAQQQGPTGTVQLDTSANLIVGRSDAPQQSGVFEVNAINAAYDEVIIDDTAISESTILQKYNAGKNTPWENSIAVPASRFADDLLRPRYHAMPPANWTNEPHGLVAFNGQYHMFYQRTPNGPYKWMMHWGHMVSNNFMDWSNLKDSFYPSLNINGQSGLGSKGIWSGNVVVDNGVAHAFYTTVNFDGRFDPGVAWATSSEGDLQNWTKRGGIIDKNSPNPGGIADFRDPYVWKQGGLWHMIIGTALGSGGALEHYTTADLNSANWQRAPQPFVNVPFSSMDIGSAIWEMPVFEKLGVINGVEKYILVVSPIGGAMRKNDSPYVRSVYWIGTWSQANSAAGQFIPDFTTPKNLDVIHGHLSPTITRSSAGDLVGIGIVDERSNSQLQNDLGWAHTFSLPRKWSLLSDGKTLGQEPVAQSTALRVPGSQQTVNNISVQGEYVLSASGNQTEIVINIDPTKTGQEYGFYINMSPDKDESTKIYFDGRDIVIDKSNSSNLGGLEETGIYRGAYDVAAFGKPESFHVFIDHSVIDVFINNKAAFSNRIYSTRADSTKISLYSLGGATQVNSVNIYQLEKSASNNSSSSSSSVMSSTSSSVVSSAVSSTVSSSASSQSISSKASSSSSSSSSIVSISSSSTSSATNSELVLDFESGTLVNWTANGAAFSLGDVATDTTYWSGTPFSQQGTYHLWGFKDGGDAQIGTLTSKSFILGGNGKINFLVSGGDDFNNLYVGVVRVSDGLLIGKVSGNNSETYVRKTIDVSAYIGVELAIKLVDNATGGFGHINVDDIHIPTGPLVQNLVFDFEAGNLNGWTTIGSAFSVADITTDSCYWNECLPFGKQGSRFLWGFKDGGDAQVGELRSASFTLAGSGQISFMLGGGNDINNLYIALVDAGSNQELLKITANNSEAFTTMTMNASSFVGRLCYLKLVDKATGGWGHLNLDNVIIPVLN